MKYLQQVALDPWGKATQGILHSYTLYSDPSELYWPILLGNKIRLSRLLLLLGYQEGAYKVMSLCTNAVMNCNFSFRRKHNALDMMKGMLSCFLFFLFETLDPFISSEMFEWWRERFTFLYINRQSQCKEKKRNGMLKYESLKLTFQGVLRIMILLFIVLFLT